MANEPPDAREPVDLFRLNMRENLRVVIHGLRAEKTGSTGRHYFFRCCARRLASSRRLVVPPGSGSGFCSASGGAAVVGGRGPLAVPQLDGLRDRLQVERPELRDPIGEEAVLLAHDLFGDA